MVYEQYYNKTTWLLTRGRKPFSNIPPMNINITLLFDQNISIYILYYVKPHLTIYEMFIMKNEKKNDENFRFWTDKNVIAEKN